MKTIVMLRYESDKSEHTLNLREPFFPRGTSFHHAFRPMLYSSFSLFGFTGEDDDVATTPTSATGEGSGEIDGYIVGFAALIVST
jgi:hypothetical protein